MKSPPLPDLVANVYIDSTVDPGGTSSESPCQVGIKMKNKFIERDMFVVGIADLGASIVRTATLGVAKPDWGKEVYRRIEKSKRQGEMGVFSSLFSGVNQKNKIIATGIQHLSKEGSVIGTAYKEISYRDVVRYIKANGCKVLAVTKKPRGDWIEFLTEVDGVSYTVWLDCAFDGHGSVLSSRRNQ